MLQRRRVIIPLVLVLALIGQACGPNQLRSARKSAHRIQVVVDAATDTTATLFHDGVIDVAKKNQIVHVLIRINQGNSVLINKVAAATADTPELRTSLLDELKLIEEAVKELKSLGVLGIKSKNGSLAFESAINALDSAIALAQAALAGGGK